MFLLCVGFSVAAGYNVMADNVEVRRMANELACGEQGEACRPTVTREERTPIGQSFSIVTAKRTVDVRCARSLYLVGDYACALQ